ncbi:MAG: hypothetical protein Q9221_001734 [Calogaya cf. arnoldii]
MSSPAQSNLLKPPVEHNLDDILRRIDIFAEKYDGSSIKEEAAKDPKDEKLLSALSNDYCDLEHTVKRFTAVGSSAQEFRDKWGTLESS